MAHGKWKTMTPASIPESEMVKVRANCMVWGLSDEETEKCVEDVRSAPIFMNDKYQCAVYEAEMYSKNFPALWHLSIKRLDKKAIMDWRDMQRIKNDVIGPNTEGVQLFPNEKRKVDTANQFHIFVIKSEDTLFPFGFMEAASTDVAPIGGAQREGVDE